MANDVVLDAPDGTRVCLKFDRACTIQPDSVYCVGNMGYIQQHAEQRGNLYVRFRVVFPKYV